LIDELNENEESEREAREKTDIPWYKRAPPGLIPWLGIEKHSNIGGIPTLEQLLEYTTLFARTITFRNAEGALSDYKNYTYAAEFVGTLHLNPFAWLLEDALLGGLYRSVADSELGKAIPVSLQDLFTALDYWFIDPKWTDGVGRPTLEENPFLILQIWWGMHDLVDPRDWIDNAMAYMTSTDAFFGTEVADDLILLGLTAIFDGSTPGLGLARTLFGTVNMLADMGKSLMEFGKPMYQLLSTIKYGIIWGQIPPERREALKDALITYGFTDYNEYETVESLSREVLEEIQKIAELGFLSDFVNPDVHAYVSEDLSLIPDKAKMNFGLDSLEALVKSLNWIYNLAPEQMNFVLGEIHNLSVLFYNCYEGGKALYSPRAPTMVLWTYLKSLFTTKEGLETLTWDDEEWQAFMDDMTGGLDFNYWELSPTVPMIMQHHYSKDDWEAFWDGFVDNYDIRLYFEEVEPPYEGDFLDKDKEDTSEDVQEDFDPGTAEGETPIQRKIKDIIFGGPSVEP
jgi:hypothetical protein